MEKTLIQHIKNTGDFYFYEDREYYEHKPIALDFLRRVTVGMAENTKRLSGVIKNDFPLSYGKESVKGIMIPALDELSHGFFITGYDLMRNSKNAPFLYEGIKDTEVDYFVNFRKCDIYIQHLHHTVNITTAAATASVVKNWNEATDHVLKIKDLCRTTTTTSAKKERVLRVVLMTVTGVLLQRDIAKHTAIDESTVEKIRDSFTAVLKNPPNFCGGWVIDNSLISQDEYFSKGETYPVVLFLGSVIY